MKLFCTLILCVFSGLIHASEYKLIGFNSSECLDEKSSERAETIINSTDGKVNASFLLTLNNGSVFGDSTVKYEEESLAVYIESYRPDGIRIKETCDTILDIEIEWDSKTAENLIVYLDDKMYHRIKIPNQKSVIDAKSAQHN